MPSSIPLEKLFAIIHEDNELLAINKPAGLVCHPTKTDEYSSLISRVRLYLGKDQPAHLVNRLDRETSGITLVAKTDDSAREVRRLWENRSVEKEYLAIVHGHVREDTGLIDAPLGKDESSRVAVKDCVRADGLPSQTEFTVVKRFSRAEGEFTQLRVRLLTGRKHQIRIHTRAPPAIRLSAIKFTVATKTCISLWSRMRLTEEHRRKLILPNQALHAGKLRFTWRSRDVEFKCEPEKWFARISRRGKSRRRLNNLEFNLRSALPLWH